MLVHAKLKAGDFPNCRKMAVELEVSPKTIQRDVDFMRDRLGLPIEYDQLQFGFFYSEPVTSFPSIEVSEGEIVALYVAQKALEQYEGTPYAKPLKTAFAKISEGLRETVSFTWSDMDEIVSFRSAGRSTADIELFEELSRAVLRQVEVEFDYKKLGGKGHQPRRVHPYHLGCVENLWYLFSFDTARSQLRTFALTRMRNLRVSKSRFRRPPDFSVGKLLQQSFGVYAASAKAAETIRIRFDSFAAQLVQERQWHESQRITQLPDGKVELTFELSALEEVERWILSWGAHAEVLQPNQLAERIAQTGAALAARSSPTRTAPELPSPSQASTSRRVRSRPPRSGRH